MSLFYGVTINKDFLFKNFTLSEDSSSIVIGFRNKKENVKIIVKEEKSKFLDIRTGRDIKDLCVNQDVILHELDFNDGFSNMFTLTKKKLNIYSKKLDYVSKSLHSK